MIDVASIRPTLPAPLDVDPGTLAIFKIQLDLLKMMANEDIIDDAQVQTLFLGATGGLESIREEMRTWPTADRDRGFEDVSFLSSHLCECMKNIQKQRDKIRANNLQEDPVQAYMARVLDSSPSVYH